MRPIVCSLPKAGRFGLAFALIAAAGCGSDPNSPQPVSGEVVFEDGQRATELAGWSVSFTPADDPRRGSSIGAVEDDGTFTLTSLKENDGAVAGKHHVVLSPPDPDVDMDDPKRDRRKKPEQIIAPESASQEATVEVGRNSIKLTVRRAKS